MAENRSGTGQSVRDEAPRLKYDIAPKCRNHHWGLLLGCAPKTVHVRMKIDFQKIIAKTTEIDKDLLPDSKNKTKRHAKIQVYEDQHGDDSEELLVPDEKAKGVL